jgi:hypothetical protein
MVGFEENPKFELTFQKSILTQTSKGKNLTTSRLRESFFRIQKMPGIPGKA